MSLPREWSLQDSRGSMHRFSGPTCSITANTTRHSEQYQFPTHAQKLLQQQKEPFLPTTDVSAFENHYQQTQSNRNSLLSDTHSAAGSLFSIHSAPPTGMPESGLHNAGGRGIENGTDSPRRPVSLAIDSFKSMQHALPHQTSEIEEDDNENLLTVSSLTARPLIAKSHELRSNRMAERRKRNIRSADPPDGGYGWLVVFGAFSVQFWVAGLVKSYGVLYVEIMETFPMSSAALASWIPAILSALCLALAPLSSALCQRFSCRIVVFIGGIFCALGLTLSYFATSMVHLLFTFGVLTGIGGGLSTTPGIVIVSQYFDKHRALANGICVSGTAAGSFVFPMLIEHLVHLFGFHGTILILGGCMLHVCVSATIYRPLEDKDEQSTTNATTISLLSSTVTSTNNNNSSSNMNHRNQSCSSAINFNARGVNNGGIIGCNTNSTYISSSEEPLNNNKKYIEHLFLEECKNRINDFYNTNKFVNVTDKVLHLDSDDEIKDVVGETTFMKQIGSVRSSSILHSVEDLSTDSTFVYKNRTGFDSNRGSRRRNKNAFSTDEILNKMPGNNSSSELISSSTPVTQNRGLSKSMIIPTPVSDFSEFEDVHDRKTRKTCCDRIKMYLDVSLLKDPVFILMCLSVTMMSTGCPYMLFYLPAYVTSAGYTKSEAGYLVAVSAALDLIGRLGLGWLSDFQLFDRKKTYIICIIGAGLSVLLIPFGNSWYILGFAAGMYGLCLGSWYLLVPVLLADIFGTDRISSSYGLVRMFQSIGAISVPPLAGFARDITGGYEVCFYSMGTCMVLGSIPLILSTIIYDNISRSDNIDDDNDVGTIS